MYKHPHRQPLSAVWNAVLAGAGTRPHIDCEKIDGQVYIKEVRFKHDSFDVGSFKEFTHMYST